MLDTLSTLATVLGLVLVALGVGLAFGVPAGLVAAGVELVVVGEFTPAARARGSRTDVRS